MKKLFALIALIGAAISFTANAQPDAPTYAPQTLLSSYIVTGGQTSNNVAIIDCRKQQNLALLFSDTGATNVALSFSVSIDGATFDTNHWLVSWTNATPSASVPFNLATNLPVAGYGYVRLDRFTVAGTPNSTNTAKYGVKISSP